MAPFPKIEVEALLKGLYLTCPCKTWAREGGVVKRLSTINQELSMLWYTGNPTKTARTELHFLSSNVINVTINKLWVSLHIIAARATYRRRCVPRHEDQGHWWVFLHSSDKSRLLIRTKKTTKQIKRFKINKIIHHAIEHEERTTCILHNFTAWLVSNWAKKQLNCMCMP